MNHLASGQTDILGFFVLVVYLLSNYLILERRNVKMYTMVVHVCMYAEYHVI